MQKSIVILFFSVTIIGGNVYAQTIERYNSFHYNVNQGMLQSTVNDIAFDENNFCWISYSNGLQKFDGEQFISIHVQEGLTEDSDLKFFKTKSGALLFSYPDGISKYDINQNKFKQIYKSEETDPRARKFLGEVNGIIYFISSNGFISGLDQLTFKSVQYFESQLPLSDKGTFGNLIASRDIYNNKIAVSTGQGLYLIDLKNQQLKEAQNLQHVATNNFIHLVSDHEVLYYTSEENPVLVSYNFYTKNPITLSRVSFKSSKVFRSVFHNWQNRTVISNSNEIYIIDSSFSKLKTRLVNYQNKPLSGKSVIKDIKEDNYGNLYLLTISHGFIKVIKNNYPIKYFGAPESENNFVISLFADKEKNRIIAGTSGDGILVFDTSQNLVKHIKYLPGKNTSFSPSAIIKHDRDYFLFIFFGNEIRRLDGNLNWLNSIPIKKMNSSPHQNIDYFSKLLFQNEHTAIVQSGSSFYKIDFINHSARQYLFSTENIISALYFKGKIITHSNDVLYFTDTINFSVLKKIPFKNTGGVRCYATDKEGNIYIGGNKGIFKIDETGKILKHYSKETGLPDDCIYAMVFGRDGDLWCSSNKGIFKISPEQKILQLTREDGMQENEFNTNVVQTLKDGELYFGGVNGISSFYPNDINNFNERINLLFTDIRINNQQLNAGHSSWNVKKLRLPHDKNYLSFDFLAMANSNPAQYIYQYRMEPIDKEWIQNSGLQTVRYQLPPGKYTFKVYAGKSFNQEAGALKQIDIYIRAPFWQTWWFYVSITLVTISIFAIGLNRYNRYRYLKRLRALKNETRIQKERERISRDLHDNIGAYANAVLYNTELLGKEEGADEQASIMRELRFASKDIITSLRETIWALKKESFTAEECFLRIKNFIQPFARYYPKIKFKIIGNASPDKILPYQRALNIVRIIQEGISNSLKHADAHLITIISEQTGDTWEITIKDDGRGFNLEQSKEIAGNGLQNMETRAKDGNFDLRIFSESRKGTSIKIIID